MKWLLLVLLSIHILNSDLFAKELDECSSAESCFNNAVRLEGEGKAIKSNILYEKSCSLNSEKGCFIIAGKSIQEVMTYSKNPKALNEKYELLKEKLNKALMNFNKSCKLGFQQGCKSIKVVEQLSDVLNQNRVQVLNKKIKSNLKSENTSFVNDKQKLWIYSPSKKKCMKTEYSLNYFRERNSNIEKLSKEKFLISYNNIMMSCAMNEVKCKEMGKLIEKDSKGKDLGNLTPAKIFFELQYQVIMMDPIV